MSMIQLRTAVIALLGCCQTITLDAQTHTVVTPSVGASEVYDSNLLSTPSNEQDDLITRITPAIQAEYRAPLWTLSGRQALDVERFEHHPELNSMIAREQSGARVEYRPSARLLVDTAAEFSTTQNPGELNPVTGLAFTRATARRVAARAAATRQMNPVTQAALAYTVTEDWLAGGLGSRTQTASVTADRRVSARATVGASYQCREFSLASSSITSNVLTVGWTDAVTPHATIAINGGRR